MAALQRQQPPLDLRQPGLRPPGQPGHHIQAQAPAQPRRAHPRADLGRRLHVVPRPLGSTVAPAVRSRAGPFTANVPRHTRRRACGAGGRCRGSGAARQPIFWQSPQPSVLNALSVGAIVTTAGPHSTSPLRPRDEWRAAMRDQPAASGAGPDPAGAGQRMLRRGAQHARPTIPTRHRPGARSSRRSPRSGPDRVAGTPLQSRSRRSGKTSAGGAGIASRVRSMRVV